MVFSSFKIKNLIIVKDFVPQSYRSSVSYTFNCGGCNSVYVGDKSRHLSTRVREHLYSDKNSHIFRYVKSSDKCRNSCIDNFFTVLYTASTYNQLKIEEALHIMWENPTLNKQVKH